MKRILWRNSCWKVVGEDFWNYHTVLHIASIFCKNSVKLTFYYRPLPWKIAWQRISIFPHSMVKREILSHRNLFSSNQLFSNFFSKTIDFTKCLRKKVWDRISAISTLYFPHWAVWKSQKFTLTIRQKIFRQINYLAIRFL